MSSTPPREPHLLRFGLRQMLLFVTLICVLLALLVLTKGPWPLAIGASAVLVAAHVFGTLIGNRLRDTAQDVVEWRAANPTIEDDLPEVNVKHTNTATPVLPPATPLADHGRVSNWLRWFLAAGAILGTFIGGTILELSLGQRIGWAGWVVGVISCGVLGIWAVFLANSFWSIIRQAWRHSHEKES